MIGRRGPLARIAALVLAVLAVNFVVASLLPSGAPKRVSYSPVFTGQLQARNVTEISSQGDSISGRFRTAVSVPGAGKVTSFRTQIPSYASHRQLSALLEHDGATVNASPPSGGRGFVGNLLIGLLPTALLVAAMVWLYRRAAAQGGGLLPMARSRARLADPAAQRTTFADVAGIDEARDELTEVVDFLRSPAKYRRLGARIPRGVLLTGPPGTGKTLLARAVAGEAGAPFFSASAAEFVEMIVGVGASRVRDLFEQAKAAAPSIIFIDELDAVARRRGTAAAVGGHDEGEQTLNQILTEMDGFDPSTGVIVLAATNRPEVLDPALLRPGRFDRRVAVQAPDAAGRRMILAVHTRRVLLGGDVDLDGIAATTPGMVGADLANLVNEAALLAARRGHDAVGMADFADAMEKLVLGAARKVILSAEERERTAYHEAGHAITGMLSPKADPVRKVSIIPRGSALGVTFSAPDADRFSYDEDYLRARIRVALGGRVAEELVYGSVTSGAESDIAQLTEIARNMVTRWGMSSVVGPIAVDHPDPSAQELIDHEVRRLVEELHGEVRELLAESRDRLDSLAAALLERETLDAAAAYRAAGIDRHGAPPRVAAA